MFSISNWNVTQVCDAIVDRVERVSEGETWVQHGFLEYGKCIMGNIST